MYLYLFIFIYLTATYMEGVTCMSARGLVKGIRLHVRQFDRGDNTPKACLLTKGRASRSSPARPSTSRRLSRPVYVCIYIYIYVYTCVHIYIYIFVHSISHYDILYCDVT